MKEACKQGKYSRMQEFKMKLPYQFLLLCRVLKITPRRALYDFMRNLVGGNYAMNNEQKVKAMEYFIQCGYGQFFYTIEDMRKIFQELDAINSFWPKKGNMAVMERHSALRDKYHKSWFKRWYRKIRLNGM